MASTKKNTKKKPAPKKTSKKTSKKTPKSKKQKAPSPEEQRQQELAQHVVTAAADFVGDVQKGKIKGFILVGITESSETDVLRFVGATPPGRAVYLLELAQRISMDNAMRAIKATSGDGG